jgi:peptidoglycan/LPS O-acetylase OafA/YrhL
MTISRSTLRAAVLVLIALALAIFAGEAIHELHYADTHPGAYGPAKVIALACAAGAVLALAGAIAFALTPSDRAIPRLALLVALVAAIALGIWLVTLTSADPSSGGSGFGGPGLSTGGLP